MMRSDSGGSQHPSGTNERLHGGRGARSIEQWAHTVNGQMLNGERTGAQW
jgi:hypothetical protein